jgi:hypothetical protein
LIVEIARRFIVVLVNSRATGGGEDARASRFSQRLPSFEITETFFVSGFNQTDRYVYQDQFGVLVALVDFLKLSDDTTFHATTGIQRDETPAASTSVNSNVLH